MAQPQPFHGYYFRILTAQGPAAHGGDKDYVVNGQMSGGFALVAWPADYDASGVMTFIINGENDVHEKDLGPGTDAAASCSTSTSTATTAPGSVPATRPDGRVSSRA